MRTKMMIMAIIGAIFLAAIAVLAGLMWWLGRVVGLGDGDPCHFDRFLPMAAQTVAPAVGRHRRRGDQDHARRQFDT